jgi:hypothetical protein
MRQFKLKLNHPQRLLHPLCPLKEIKMATSDKEQMGVNVPQHKRLAMGEKLTGQTLAPKGGDKKHQGGLSGAKKK